MADIAQAMAALSRIDEAYILQEREGRGAALYHREHKARIDRLDAVLQNKWDAILPGEQAERITAFVQDVIETGLADIRRLVKESTPSTRCRPVGRKKESADASNLREHILSTYRTASRAERLQGFYAMDVAATGIAFELCKWIPDHPYPMFYRLDPRSCWPTFLDDRLVDVLYVTTMRRRLVPVLHPELDLSAPAFDSDEVEIIDYYSPTEILKAVIGTTKGSKVAAIVQREPNRLGVCPVAWCRLEQADGELRGLYDKAIDSLLTKNRIVSLMLDYGDQMVFAPFESYGIENDRELPGPRTIYRHTEPESFIRRVQPAGGNPQLYALLDFLEREQRGQTAYPASRQGEITQSIASAAFVASTQGERSSLVRDIQGHLAQMRQDSNEIAFRVDEAYLDFEKDVLVGPIKTYRPKEAIAQNYQNEVVYGAGAGLDYLNRGTKLLADVNSQILSREEAMEQNPDIPDPSETKRKIHTEAVEAIALQGLLAKAAENPDIGLDLLIAMQEGSSLVEAARKVRQAEQEAAQAEAEALAAAGPQAPQLPGVVSPEQTEAGVRSLARGGIPGQAEAAPEAQVAALPPMPPILTRGV